MSEINLYHGDSLAAMREMPDKKYDLAVVDPLYGVQQNAYREANRSKLAKTKKYHNSIWSQEKTPPEYFTELLRVSKNQIIWGGNYFTDTLPWSRGWLVWDKVNTGDFADCELAWTSFEMAVRKFRFMWNGMLQGDMKNKQNRIHPTEKPIQLYKFCLSFAKPGWKIIDTHGGSMSHAIACHDMGFNLDLWEIDADYYRDGVKRFNAHKAQSTMFTPQEMYNQ